MGTVISRNIKVSNTADKPLYIIDKSPFGEFDEVQATYPDAITEIYTYSLASTDIGTVTVIYTSSNKKDLQSVVYNAV